MEIQHRYFVQYMLKKGAVPIDVALNYCRTLPNPITDMDHLKMLIIVVNREISKQNFKIVYSQCEVTQRKLFVWINTKNDKISKLQLTYSAVELEYFHVLMQMILDSDNYSLTYVRAINVTSTLTVAYTRDSGESVLNQWISGGYFVKSGDSIYFGARLILEFTLYLKSCRPNSVCQLCSELAFIGKFCGNCGHLFHSYCIDQYLTNETKCPSCNQRWVEGQVGQIGIDRLIEACESDASSNSDNSEAPQRRLRRRTSKACS